MTDSNSRPFRFAADLKGPLEGATWADSARELEDLGYSTLFVPDHFDEGLGPIAAMAMAAAATTTLNVGALVLDCDYRHPAVLARELATIDMLSGGRLEVGLGAGWKASDYEKSGIVMDAPSVRVSRMIEHATVLKGLFAEGEFSYAGDHYTITDLDGTPAPARPGGPPFLIGGGAPRLLRFAGSIADIVGVNPSVHSGAIDADAAQDALPERIDRKIDWVKQGAGARFADIELNAWIAVGHVTDDAQGFAAAVAPVYGADPDVVLDSPMTLVGTLEEIEQRLRDRRARWGYSYTVVPAEMARAMAPVVAALAGT